VHVLGQVVFTEVPLESILLAEEEEIVQKDIPSLGTEPRQPNALD
jgi:hypothetical protein